VQTRRLATSFEPLNSYLPLRRPSYTWAKPRAIQLFWRENPRILLDVKVLSNNSVHGHSKTLHKFLSSSFIIHDSSLYLYQVFNDVSYHSAWNHWLHLSIKWVFTCQIKFRFLYFDNISQLCRWF